MPLYYTVAGRSVSLTMTYCEESPERSGDDRQQGRQIGEMREERDGFAQLVKCDGVWLCLGQTYVIWCY